MSNSLWPHGLDCSPPGSSVHGILQTRILEWVSMPFSRVSSQPMGQTPVSHIAGRFLTIWATKKACCEEMRNDFKNTWYISLKHWPNINSTYSSVAVGIFGDWNTILGWNSRTVEFVCQFGRCLLEVFCVCSMLGLCGEKSTSVKFRAVMWCSRKNLELGIRRPGFNPGCHPALGGSGWAV